MVVGKKAWSDSASATSTPPPSATLGANAVSAPPPLSAALGVNGASGAQMPPLSNSLPLSNSAVSTFCGEIVFVASSPNCFVRNIQ